VHSPILHESTHFSKVEEARIEELLFFNELKQDLKTAAFKKEPF